MTKNSDNSDIEDDNETAFEDIDDAEAALSTHIHPRTSSFHR